MIQGLPYPVSIGAEALPALCAAASGYSSLTLLMDKHTQRDCYPLLKPFLPAHSTFVIPPGESFKTLESCSQLWQQLSAEGVDRNGLLLNLGGGVVCDLGGFAASVYKRGIGFLHAPTSLLAMTDASIGGKTGLDFQGIKNLIGLVVNPLGVYIWPEFLHTLPARELRAGFAEIVKHHLIADAEGWQQLSRLKTLYGVDWLSLIRHSLSLKAAIVLQDPDDKGIRQVLNFGHSIGHAVESYYLSQKNFLLHGEAVAIGMVAEAFISKEKGWISDDSLQLISRFLLTHFDLPAIPAATYPAIIRLMGYDKKNAGGALRMSLPEGPGACRTGVAVEPEAVEAALAYYSAAAASR